MGRNPRRNDISLIIRSCGSRIADLEVGISDAIELNISHAGVTLKGGGE